ncbi:MAG: excinuclease ABC subunit B [Elusimicrobia bacterium RIFCSPLOWO2_02_FULL_39_32]|nr:MAG: excinuclease ABC subunit B [Elusimicrobia bacterium GWA2_38_7]OGR78883.1 MAG: excinuclease ABC subunit B [Elusimicrobia bacterium RIFCSPHIGHO2_02_FULL_39_36]OGR91703.1 MAG: excinuclease ABC subunit B [Elusimicrobia bacterium RIFCSPLOWO2_02_FULL_39_32]OGR99155.1 MAG: excinuclease ABC subunit B [Elusimicrobia bacterium RIFCSPLOWO2_12_FULL_39_28]
MYQFNLCSKFTPQGDQPKAIKALVQGLKEERSHQVLMGVTGSGKTFTMANVICAMQKPTLVISPNKILAAQLYAEFKQFFPKNAVEYFISYYDYYQPEAYVPQSDTYIEKDASINDHIDRLRLKATSSLLERKDVIIVASVSCIYGLGSPRDYRDLCLYLEKGRTKSRELILQELVTIHYERNDLAFTRGKFRVKGDTVEIFPAYMETALRIQLRGNEIEKIYEIHPLTGEKLGEKELVYIYPARHFVTTQPTLDRALGAIEQELKERVLFFKEKGKLLEAERILQRTNYDLEMMRETGFCHGIENYSRHISGRAAGERPSCLLDYYPKDFLVFIDESHVTAPQIKGMYEGDQARKNILVQYGFRLPSALDNRPLKNPEFEALVKNVLYVSATPSSYEFQKSKGAVVEQVIRPTGLVDPEIEIHPIKGQIDHLIKEIELRVKRKERVLVTTLTKRLAEDLSQFLSQKKLKVRYLHSDIDALKRVEIIKDLRKGAFDVLVGINLLREGLDLPEVSLVAILDADKEGFLRSETTLIQICGRAARHLNGKVIFYADFMTGSMKRALGEMNRRRKIQLEYNQTHHITPKTIVKAIDEMEEFQIKAKKQGLSLLRENRLQYAGKNLPEMMKEIEAQMKEAAERLDFETAALLRDQLFEFKEMRAHKKHGKISAAFR